MFPTDVVMAKGTPVRPTTGGSTIGAGTAVTFAWTGTRVLTELQNDTGERVYGIYNPAAGAVASPQNYQFYLEDGDRRLIAHVGIDSLSLYAVAAANLGPATAPAVQNLTAQGWV
jgi:hypothetical protein